MIVAELDEVQYDLEVEGELVRKQRHRRIWQSRGWATVAIAYDERASDGSWRSKLALIRFQRVREAWKKHAALTLSNKDARELGGLLAAWTTDAADAPDDVDADDN